MLMCFSGSLILLSVESEAQVVSVIKANINCPQSHLWMKKNTFTATVLLVHIYV